MPEVLPNESLVDVLVICFKGVGSPTGFTDSWGHGLQGSHPALEPCFKHWVVGCGGWFNHGSDDSILHGGGVISDPLVYHVHLCAVEVSIDAVLGGKVDMGLEVGVCGTDVGDFDGWVAT